MPRNKALYRIQHNYYLGLKTKTRAKKCEFVLDFLLLFSDLLMDL